MRTIKKYSIAIPRRGAFTVVGDDDGGSGGGGGQVSSERELGPREERSALFDVACSPPIRGRCMVILKQLMLSLHSMWRRINWVVGFTFQGIQSSAKSVENALQGSPVPTLKVERFAYQFTIQK